MSTTLLSVSPTDIINPKHLQEMGFSLEKALPTVLPAAVSTSTSTSETEDLESDSNQESTRTGDSQAASVQYVQLHSKAVGSSQAS